VLQDLMTVGAVYSLLSYLVGLPSWLTFRHVHIYYNFPAVSAGTQNGAGQYRFPVLNQGFWSGLCSYHKNKLLQAAGR
jgi:hypothetical protein